MTATVLSFPHAARAVSCTGSQITYEETGDTGDSHPTCGGSFQTCETPILGAPVVTLDDPGCDLYADNGTCGVTATATAEFPGNHQNDPFASGGFYSYANVTLENSAGNVVGSCGVPGSVISQDLGTITVTAGVTCTDPDAGRYRLVATMCRDRGSCEKTESVPLDLAAAVGCEPKEQDCGDGASCEQCLPGGACTCGDGPGFGGDGAPGGDTGGGAYLSYSAGGAGRQNLPGSAAWNVALGRYWSMDYAERLVQVPDASHVWMITRHATYRRFWDDDGDGLYERATPSTELRQLEHLGVGVGWQLTDFRGTVQRFDDAGFWLSTTDRHGNAKTATYSGGQLTSVAFPDGTREDFAYEASPSANGKLASITVWGVDGTTSRVWSYGWSGDDLVRIDRPDGTALLYRYDDPRFPGYLTRIELEGTDGSTRVERAYEYDASGNTIATWKGDVSSTGPEAVDLWRLSFDDPTEPTETTVTDPLGNVSVQTIERDTDSSASKVVSISGDCPTCGLGPNSQLTYGDPAHPLRSTRITDGRGITTVMSYDAFGQRVSRTEAFGEAEERTTTWTYDATYPALVTSILRPSVAGGAMSRATDLIRDGSGDVTARTESGVESGSAFALTTATTYNAAGMPLWVDPPGHGTTDEVAFAYDAARGDLVLTSRTDPLVGATTFGHDAFNRRTSVTDPNGVETTTAYDPLDRVTEIRQVGASPGVDDLVTTHEYTAFGDLFRTTLPAGNVIEYGYDGAGRLVSVERKPDASTLGERVLYELDDYGHRTNETLQRWDGASSSWVTHGETAFEYSSRCHLDRTVQAPGTPEEAVTEYELDCNGNLSAVWDAEHDPVADPPTTSYGYDALDRLVTVSQPWGGAGGGSITTTYGFDVQDHLTSVTDAESNVTTYEYSDRDLLTEEVSPASGTTTHAYGDHGELISTTDARGVTVSRTVDALGRVTAVDFPDDTLDIAYTYDDPAVPFSSGRLTAITRNGSTVAYEYDRFGRTTRDGVLTFSHDANGNRTAVGYPGGVSATYGFDFADREVSLSVTTPGGTETVAPSADYLPSGPLASVALGNGVTEGRSFDHRYQPTEIALAGAGLADRVWTYSSDGLGNVLEIVETLDCAGGSSLLLTNQTVTTTETFTACGDLEAGDGFAVEAPGDVRFEAAGAIVLADGFSVGAGASFVAAPLGSLELSRRTFAYQDPQSFLTSATGPWGDLAWTYDRIGNRLSETRDGATDTYTYTSNGTGNSPLLDSVTLGATLGTRDYTWGAAGHLEAVDASGNLLDFASDDDGRLAAIDRAAGTDAVSLRYDGRSFLTEASTTAGGTRSVSPVYDSSGLVHALRRTASPTSNEELVVFFYLAGRPVAQVAIDETGVETWTYLTTDHLGTPLVATDGGGSVVWEGGFEPFGRDSQEGTASGAAENEVFLRLPGQWEDGTWEGASSGAEVYYNVHRWFEVGTGRYTRPDPLGGTRDVNARVGALASHSYAGLNPLTSSDPLGLYTIQGSESFKQRVEAGFDEIRDGLEDSECCRGYFEDLGVDLEGWTSPGGAPYIRMAEGRLQRTMKQRNVCGVAQKAAPHLYFWVNPDCLERPNPCVAASIVLHEIGHLARQDTADNEPRDFFEACILGGGCVNPGKYR